MREHGVGAHEARVGVRVARLLAGVVDDQRAIRRFELLLEAAAAGLERYALQTKSSRNSARLVVLASKERKLGYWLGSFPHRAGRMPAGAVVHGWCARIACPLRIGLSRPSSPLSLLAHDGTVLPGVPRSDEMTPTCRLRTGVWSGTMSMFRSGGDTSWLMSVAKLRARLAWLAAIELELSISNRMSTESTALFWIASVTLLWSERADGQAAAPSVGGVVGASPTVAASTPASTAPPGLM